MSRKHLVFIVNKKSGIDREKAIQAVVERTLDKEKYSYEIQHTEYRNHGTELAREAAEKRVYAVVAVGGDGSVNDVLISSEFAKSKRRGFAAYSWLVTKHLWMYKENNWHINIDGKEFTEKAFLISVANGKQFGYNFQIAPEASWTDGLFDIVIIRKFPKMLGGALVMRAMKGSLLKSPYVKHYRGKEVIISHPSLNMMQLDGDAKPCDNKIHFHLESRIQKVLTP